ncbi:hypothetical protein AVEN_186906-1 [Araneus ventricosus]|uniref:Uncharacterized protein n=1 Tax=Araneus ventricosus TaxID=182803 RepID=A0A4Y2N947_ARAVE|nr:hypothetical protein AVEN_186906-1 [Araneus ventricosus]
MFNSSYENHQLIVSWNAGGLKGKSLVYRSKQRRGESACPSERGAEWGIYFRTIKVAVPKAQPEDAAIVYETLD